MDIITYYNSRLKIFAQTTNNFFDDSNPPKYQKFKTDKLPVVKKIIKQDWQFLLAYLE